MRMYSRKAPSHQVQLFHRLLAFLLCILSCYLLHMSSFRIGVICCSVFPPVYHCSASVLLFRDIPTASQVFSCSASIPLFHWCSEFRSSAFRCSWFYGYTVSRSVEVNTGKCCKFLLLQFSFKICESKLVVKIISHNFSHNPNASRKLLD